MAEPSTPLANTPELGPVESRALVLIDRYAVTTRWITALAAGVFSLLSSQVSVWQIPISAGVVGWSVLRLGQRKRRSTPLLLVLDLVVVCFVALTTPLTTTASQVVNQMGLGVNVANPASLTFAWLPRRRTAILLCVIVISSYLIGASMVPGIGPPWTTDSFYLLPVQAAVSRALVEIFLPAARAADRAAAARLAAAVELEVATARRAAEREHWAVLHDTAASTLLMVGEGIPSSANDRIRRQARRDLTTLGQLASESATDNVDLTEAILRLLTDTALQVEFNIAAEPHVPDPVAQATMRAVGEVLTNIERHAGVESATVELAALGDGFQITISDSGSGFDPSLRGRGLRESVVARMRRVGGDVVIRSSPQTGTVVELRWRPT